MCADQPFTRRQANQPRGMIFSQRYQKIYSQEAEIALSNKKRLDILVTEQGLAPSREKAKVLIMAGEVLVDGQREDKPGTTFSQDVRISLKSSRPFPFVSRGGLKLDKAVKAFGLDLRDRVCMDVGSSTGGFTDVMLQNGAKSVYSVDVGYGQLDWKLRNDPRVTVMEKTNIRYLTPDQIGEKPSFVSTDVSFISLTKVLGPERELMADDAYAVCLIKPQFEAGREKVGKKGVVRDPKVHLEVVRTILSWTDANGFQILGLDFSPVKGPEGNIEYLLYLHKADRGQTDRDRAEEEESLQAEANRKESGRSLDFWSERAEEIVKSAHEALDK